MPLRPTQPNGKVRSLTVRPIQSADLAFEMPGVLSSQNIEKAKLGERVKKYDLDSEIYRFLNEADQSSGLFKYDAENILNKLQEFILFSLNNRALRAALKQSILLRANAYLEKYSKIREISDFHKEIYANSDASKSKIKRIETLKQNHEEKLAELVGKYNELNKKVVFDTKTTVKMTPLATKTTGYTLAVKTSEHTVPDVTNKPQVLKGATWTDLESAGDIGSSTNATLFSQETATELVDFKFPLKDEEIALQRIELDIQDEWLKHQLINLRVQNLSQIMNNELQQMELDITKFQNSLLQTVLITPISGIVTAIYKDVGETVNAGEPVIRVENDEELLVVGFIQYRGFLKLQQEVTLVTKIFETNETKEITGKLAAIRGHDADDDEWDVIIHCSNAENPEDRIIPINYHFDKDTTELYIHPVN